MRVCRSCRGWDHESAAGSWADDSSPRRLCSQAERYLKSKKADNWEEELGDDSDVGRASPRQTLAFASVCCDGQTERFSLSLPRCREEYWKGLTSKQPKKGGKAGAGGKKAAAGGRAAAAAAEESDGGDGDDDGEDSDDGAAAPPPKRKAPAGGAAKGGASPAAGGASQKPKKKKGKKPGDQQTPGSGKKKGRSK